MKIRRRTVVATPLALGGVLAGCHRRPPAGGSPSDLAGFTLRAGDQMALVRSQLGLSGQLEGLPYTIRWAPFPAGPPLLEAMNAGAVDIGGVGGTPAIFAQAAGWPIRVVAAIRIDPAFEAIIAPRGSRLRDAGDLRGKKVAVARGSSAHYLLLAALQRARLRFADIEPVYLTPNDAQPAFQNGYLDAWAVWDPFVANNTLRGAVRVTDGVGLSQGLGLVVTTAAALAEPRRAAAVADYLRRYKVSQVWANAHQPAWQKEYARLTGLPPEVVADMFTRYRPRFVPLDQAVLGPHQKVADAFLEAGLLARRVVVAACFDRRFDEPGAT
jgi:sulfonate transport system substrate-binding protein